MLNSGEKGTVLQKDKKTYAIAPHVPCGVITPKQLKSIANTASKYNITAIKITSAARIALVGIQEKDIDNVWKDLEMKPGHAVGLCVRSIKVCPGTTFCALAKQNSLEIGMKLDKIYHGMVLPSKTKIGVSGCNNQCAENCIKDISIVGKSKGWVFMAGGKGTGKPRLADTIAESLTSDEAIKIIDKTINFYKKTAKKGERIGKMIDRIGIDKFKLSIV